MLLPLRTVFFGTSDVALPSLELLAEDPAFHIVAVVTQPDRPAGRKHVLTASPIKELAIKLSLPILQFERIKSEEALTALRELQAPLAVVMSFGQIIPQAALDLYALGAINIHPSLLPKYRGASPIAAAILHGDTKTGVTIMKMDALMDHGPIYAQVHTSVEPQDTTETLSERLSHVSATLLQKTLHLAFIDGSLQPQEQDHTQATTVGLFQREDGLLDWTKPAIALERQIRAYHPWPGSYTAFEGKRLKIFRSILGTPTSRDPGTTFIEDTLPAVACGDGVSLFLTNVQPEGGNMMDGATFLRGRKEWADGNMKE